MSVDPPQNQLAAISGDGVWFAALARIHLLFNRGELDQRVNEGWPAYEAELKKAGVRYTAHMYPGANHGFHNDTTPRYDEAAAKLAWSRTVEFFKKTLRA